MRWKSFHVENSDSIRVFGITLALLFGHTPGGNPLLTFIVSRDKWAKAVQIGQGD